MYDIVTFGSATWDIFMRPKDFQIFKNRKFITGKGICLDLGSKVDIGDIKFFSGGGGTNTAATFSKKGFKVAYCGMIGNDLGGDKIIKELKQLGIETRFIIKTGIKPTNTSVILSVENQDRIILVYRGASELLRKSDIPFRKLKAKWFYLAPFSGMLSDFTNEIVNFAHENKIKVAFNPGNSQLSLSRSLLKEIIGKVDVLILNQEEASLLTGISYQKEREIFKNIDKICPGIVIMTEGPKGAVVSDGNHLYQAKASRIKVTDSTGAGDSFGAGFVSGLIISDGNINFSIQLGMANAASCLKKWGAKKGLLEKNEKFEKVKVNKKIIK